MEEESRHRRHNEACEVSTEVMAIYNHCAVIFRDVIKIDTMQGTNDNK